MTHRLQVAGFVVLGLVLVGLGTRADAWWTIVGGVGAWATAAWIGTSTPPLTRGSDSTTPRP